MLFGDASIDPKKLIHKLVDEIRQYDGGNTWRYGDNKPWTDAVKIGLGNIARNLPVATSYVYTAFELGAREFLLDIVWWTKANGEGASLACECEWYFSRSGKVEAYALHVSENLRSS